MSMTPHDLALSKAKITLMSRPESTFFTTLCFSLKTKWDDSVPFAATDYRTIFFNEQKFMSLTPGQRIFLLLHETMHVALLHNLRKGTREHKKWNIACDYYINLMLTDHGFELIPEGFHDEQYRGLSSEQIYALLPDDMACPMPDLLPPPDDADMGTIEQDVQDIVIQAVTAAKMAGDKPGSIPTDIQVYVDSLLKPKLAYHVILRKYFQSYNKNDYSFRRPNRRYFPQHYLPSMWSEALMDLAAFVDISSSVTDDEFKQFVGDLGSILKMLKPEKLTLGQFNTQITSVDKVKNVRELLKVKFNGRGGTKIAPVLNWANEHKPRVLLIFTDGEFRWPDIRVKHTDIIWLIHNNPTFTAPFGKIIHYTI